MIMEGDITQSNLKHVEVRCRFEFVFTINNKKIHAGCAMFSGSEYVYLNDKLISQTKIQRTLSFHEFVINNENYRIEFEIMNKLAGILYKCQARISSTLKVTSDLYHRHQPSVEF